MQPFTVHELQVIAWFRSLSTVEALAIKSVLHSDAGFWLALCLIQRQLHRLGDLAGAQQVN